MTGAALTAGVVILVALPILAAVAFRRRNKVLWIVIAAIVALGLAGAAVGQLSGAW